MGFGRVLEAWGWGIGRVLEDSGNFDLNYSGVWPAPGLFWSKFLHPEWRSSEIGTAQSLPRTTLHIGLCIIDVIKNDV